MPGTLKGLALSSDGKGRFGHLDPYLGAAHAVAEAARNVAATGARPLAITNCMNFGNPERPVVMWQFAEAIRGMRDACLAFDTPVTGGNVSFYNESGDSAIWPTPVIGMLGLLEDYRLRVPTGFARAGLSICVLGETFAELGGSEFADVVLGVISGRPPALDLERERALLDLLHEAASGDLLAAAHDCSDGGLAVTLAEQAILSGHGFVVTVPGDLPPHVALFSESASRAVVAVAPERVEELADLAAARGVPLATVGETGGPRVVFDGLFETTVARAPRRVRGRDPAAAGRGRVIRAVTFDFWETLVSEGAGIDAEEDGTMRARQLRRWSRDPGGRRHAGERRRDRRRVRPQLGGLPRELAHERAAWAGRRHAADLRPPRAWIPRRRCVLSSSPRSTRWAGPRRSVWLRAPRLPSAA